jgi:hypothetical protein
MSPHMNKHSALTNPSLHRGALAPILLVSLIVLSGLYLTHSVTLADPSHPDLWNLARQHLKDGNTGALRALVEANPELLLQTHDDETTLLGRASYRGGLEIVTTLLALGADPNLGNPRPLTDVLLGYATHSRGSPRLTDERSDYARILVLLLQHGADYDFRRHIGKAGEIAYLEELIMTLCRTVYYDAEATQILSESDFIFHVRKSSLTKQSSVIALEAGIPLHPETPLEDPNNYIINPYCVSSIIERVVFDEG